MNHSLRATARRRSHQRELAQRLENLEQRRLLAGDVILNEIMYHPASGKAADEWIELYNPGNQSINLNDYRIAEGVDFTFPDVELGAGQYLVVAADEQAFATNYPDVSNSIGGWDGRLSNRSEDIEIEDSSGRLIERALYADSGDWAARRRELDLGVPGWSWQAPHDGEGKSLELVHALMPRDLGHNWATSQPTGGTPGAANSVAADNIAPAIVDLQHSPIIPTSLEPVTVTARIVDEQVGASASLLYRESTVAPGDFIEVAMQDTGQGGIVSAMIPEFSDGAVIEFYVRASDTAGAQRTSPAPSDEEGGQEANLLYQVDDTSRPNDVPLYRSIMTVADRNQFERQNRFSDAQMNATFVATVGGQTDVRYNVGVRYRGSGTRDNTPANNRINIPSDRDWRGVTQININAVNPRNQIAGSALMAMAGIPAADAFPVRMLGNGEDLGRGGYFTHLEVLNSDWADRHFPLDGQGNVYRGRRANEGPAGGQGAGLQYFGDNQALYVSYLKGSNRSEADYSDVVNLTNVLNNTPDENYLEEVSKVVDIDQWLRTIATIELIGYDEFSLLTGDPRGDDYAMYRGVEDARFQMVPYDLDTLFANPQGGLFRAANVPALNRFLSHPEIRARYYTQLVDLMDNALTPDRLRPTLAEMLGDVESDNRLETMHRFLERRFEYARRQIPVRLTATSDMEPADDYYRTTAAQSGSIRGEANALTTRSVEVNGLPADWNARSARWSISDIPLEPGLNRLWVQSFDTDGNETERISIGVWRDAGAPTLITEPIDSDTVWTADNGPYQVNGNISIAAEATLTIEAGTTVFFGASARLTIRGRLVAVGNEQQPVWLTRVPGSVGTWRGLQFNRSEEENVIKHAVLEYGETEDGMIGLDRSRIELDHVTLDHSSLRRIRTINSSLVVRNSTFMPIALPGQPPATDNLSEHIWGQGIPADGQWLLENNVFGHLTGHNDGIDFDAPKLPNPIPIIRNNVFEGGGDDALDLTGDVYIEGNLFSNFIKDQFNTDPGESNTISASEGTFWVVRNVFANVQHVSLVKENSFMHFLNNTVVGASTSALYFDLPGQTSGPGRGARVEGSIFAETPVVFDAVRGDTDLTVDWSLVNASDVALGSGNLSGNPHLGGMQDGYVVLPGSPALGSGPGGTDMGASIPAGAQILGEPDSVTSKTDAVLNVAGPGMTEYRFRVNDDPWSQPQPIDDPIRLSGLTDGQYTIQVIGLNAVGQWQEEADATVSRSWTVDTNLSRVRINEVLASNDGVVIHEGTQPDLVELYNEGPSSIDLSGMSLTDELGDPRKFVFPERTVIGGHQYLTLYADDATAAAGIHLGFALNSDGEALYLFDATNRGGQLLDQVEFGVQVSNLSLGRDAFSQWTLTQPTFGDANQPLRMGNPNHLRINEWLADNEVSRNNDFVELYNPDPGPVDAGGMFLTDNPIGWPDRHQLAPLSFVAGGGHATFIADGDPEDGPDHLDFSISRVQEMIGLLDETGTTLIDVIRYGPQQPDVSMGFSPDGSSTVASFRLPTPGQTNTSRTIESSRLVELESEWQYDQSGQELPTEWREVDFDDSDWLTGQGVLYVENADLPAPKNTPLQLGQNTYYFRREFQIDDPAQVQSLQITLLIDDGAVVYLNGDELHREGMADGEVNFSTSANRTVGNASLEGPLDVPISSLVAGSNIIAVEVHQANAGSSDIVFALQLDSVVERVDANLLRAEGLLDNLRLTELMYNPIGGNDFEFLEFQNVGSQTLDLTGVRIEEGVDFVFPNIQLAPEQYVVVVNDLPSFRQRHGDSVAVAGEFDRNLDNSGEEIALRLPDPFDVDILNFDYDDRWHSATDGAGFSLVVDDPTGPRRSWRDAGAWRASNFVNGSPGFVDAGLDEGIIVINEVLANTDQLRGDQIELHNTTEANLDLSNWYLSNDANTLTQYQLPEGTIVPPNGYSVFSATEDFGDQFTLADHGGTVYLASSDAIGSVAGFVATAQYGAVERNTSFGRVSISDGTFDYAAQSQITLGAENAPPLLGPIVISEVMYDPPDGDEYVELHNSGDAAVSLGDARTWSLAGAVDFAFPGGVQVGAGEYLLVVAADPDEFRNRHGVPGEVTILGPFAGTLDDQGDDLQLLRPSHDVNSPNRIIVDRVNYKNESPWPVEASDGVAALNREPLNTYGNDPASWLPSIAFGTPGRANVGIDTSPATVPSQLAWSVDVGPTIEIAWAESADPETGVATYRIYRDGVEIGASTTTEFNDVGVVAPGDYQYHVSAVNGQGLESQLSQPLDVSLMSVASVLSRFSDQLIVAFTEPVVRNSAEDSSNYAIPGVDILSATLADDDQTVALATSDIQAEVPHLLTVSNIVGLSGNPLPPGLQTAFSFREGIPGFTIRGVRTRTARARQLADVDGVLSLSPTNRAIVGDVTEIYPTINFQDDDGHASFSQFPGDTLFPTDEFGDDDNLVIHATGFLTVSEDQAGTWTFGSNIDAPQEVTRPATIVPFGSTWRFLDDGSDQATAWRESDFDDSLWAVGAGQLGYGDGDEATTVAFGPDANNKFATTYFRHRFDVAAPSLIQSITGELVNDDGGAVFLNGVEIARANLRADATASDLANDELPFFIENAPVRFTFDPALLVPGENVLAVEIHQASAESDDLSFDLSIQGIVRQNQSSDGFRLLIDGAEIIAADAGNTNTDRLGSVSLNRGAHRLDFVFFERSDGAEVELFAAQGDYTSPDETDTWRLVGDDANGGLRVRTDPLPPLPINWERELPDGSLVFGFDGDASLKGGDVPVSFASELLAGESLSLVATPNSPDAILTIKVRDVLSTFTSESSDAPGQSIAVSDFIPAADGVYLLEVSSDIASEISVEAIVNSTLEGEMLGGVSNDDIASAQDINSSERVIGGVSRLAVRGRGDGSDTSDFYAVQLATGEIVTMATVLDVSSESQLKLLASNGDLLALGIAAGDVNSISDYAVPADGTYFVQVVGDAEVDYTLVVARNAGLDATLNDSFNSAATFSRSLTTLGSLGGASGSAGPTGGKVTLPAVLVDAEGFVWDIQNFGNIDNGTGDAYDNGLSLSGFGFFTEGTYEDNDREISIGPNQSQGVTVTRKIFVPPDQAFARYLEIITNEGNQAVDFPVSISTDLGSDGATVLVGTSSGDQTFNTLDHWLVTDDGDGRDDPTMLHLISGPGALRPITATSVQDQIDVSYQLQLAPGETQIIMHFASQTTDRDTALAFADDLVHLPPGAVSGMTPTEMNQVVNFRVGDSIDVFALQLTAGQTVQLLTETPNSGPGPRVNTVDPVVAVFDASGSLVAEDDNGALDGRNASLSFTASIDGPHYVRVQSVDGKGEYVLRATVDSLVTPDLSVVSVEPTDGAILNGIPDEFIVNFSAAVDVASIDPSDLFVDNQVVTSAELIDGDSIRFALNPVIGADPADLTIRVAAGALTNYQGVGNQPFEAQYSIDSVAPRVIGTAWNNERFPETGTLPPGRLDIIAQFDELLRADGLIPASIVLEQEPMGQTRNADAVSYDVDTNLATISFSFVPEGEYKLTILSGDGALEDVAGNDLDGELVGEPNDNLLSGDGIPGGDFSISFRVDGDAIDLSEQFTPIVPAGSLISRAQTFEIISYDDDVDTFTFLAAPSDRLSISVTPNAAVDTGGSISIEARDPWARLVGHQTADVNGQTIDLAGITSPSGGRYEVRITGESIGTSYSLTITKNAVIEASDSGRALPLSIDASETFDRLAVIASSDSRNPTELVWGVQPTTGQIIIIDPTRGVLVDAFPAPGNLRQEHTQIGLTMAEVGSTLLYVNADDDPTALHRLDPFSGALKSTETIASASYDGLAFDAGKVFFGRDGVDIQRQTVTGDAPISNWSTGTPTGALAGDDYERTFGFFTDGQIHEFDPNEDTDQILSTIQPPSPDVEGLAFDNRSLFASTASGFLYTLDPDAAPEDQLLITVEVPNGPLYGLAAMTELAASGDGVVPEDESNDRLDRAQDVDEFFSLAFDTNIGDSFQNTSMQIPHVTMLGSGDGSFDFYAFDVANAGDRGIFDIDSGDDPFNSFDAHLRLYSEDGTIWAQNDDAGGDEGSSSGLDSLLEFTFFQPGRYAIEVGSCCVEGVNQSAGYQLHISIENHPLVRSKEVDLVTSGATWMYWDQPAQPAPEWTATTFDDSAWSEGRAQLGYGDGDEATTVSFGPDESNKQITTYFRKSFTVDDTSQISDLWVDLLRDDGAAVYLNGTQIAIDRLPNGAGPDDVATGDPVEGPAESTFHTFDVDVNLLHEGLNTLAVEVHQHSASDGDLSFDLRLRSGIQGDSVSLPTVPDVDAYTVDLTGRAGHSLDIILAAVTQLDAFGQPIQVDFSQQQLRLIDPAGDNVLAEATATIGDTTPTNYDLSIRDFVVPVDGVYLLEFDSVAAGDYAVLVTDNAVFDTEPNDSVDDIVRPLALPGSALGHLVGPGPSSVLDPRDAQEFNGQALDISNFEAYVEGGDLIIVVEFYDSFVPSDPNESAFGFVEMDVDQDALSGRPSFINQGLIPGQTGGPLGVEYAISFNSQSPDQAFLFDQRTDNFIDTVAFTLTSTSARMQVPLSSLGSDDGAINLGVVAGGIGINDIAPNDTFLTTRLEDGTALVSGDTYRVALQQGQTLLAATQTPTDSSGGASQLDVALEVADLDGNVVASDTGSSVDPTNAAVVFTAPADGDYLIRVSPEDGVGAYIVTQQLVEAGNPLGRYVFYNNSVLDGQDPGADPRDDDAIAVDKTALLPNQPFSFEHISNYALGINGLMIDLPDLAGTPTADDLEFRVGNDTQPEAWPLAPSPSEIDVRAEAGLAGSDRVTIVWNDHAIETQWLQVTVKANDTTGLAQADVFYFGHLAGETGDAIGLAEVTFADLQGVRNHERTEELQNQQLSAFDLNRNGRVDSDDNDITSRNIGRSLIAIFPTIPVPGSDITYGDANLDGKLSSNDLLLVLQAAEFEDHIPGNSTWSEGDWDGDGDFTTSDLVLLFQQGGFEQDEGQAAGRTQPIDRTLVSQDLTKQWAQPEFASAFRIDRPADPNGVMDIKQRQRVDDAMSTFDLRWLGDASDDTEWLARTLARSESSSSQLDEAIESVLDDTSAKAFVP